MIRKPRTFLIVLVFEFFETPCVRLVDRFESCSAVFFVLFLFEFVFGEYIIKATMHFLIVGDAEIF